MARPTLVFDGNCGFCRMWVDFWRGLTGDEVDYQASEGLQAVEYVGPEGEFSGAEAVFQLLGRVPGYQWMPRVYNIVPGFAPIAEFVYKLIAAHRNAAWHVTRALWGDRVERPSYVFASLFFARALAFVYLIAFASFGMQARGLIGSNGILPIGTFLRFAETQLGTAAFWRVPTIFWSARSDFAVLSIAWGGVALASIAILARAHSVWQKLIFVILFIYYLSIVSAGQVFMSYQWDLLLLEAGFLAIFLRPSLPRTWLFQWLVFRLMFESGVVKLLSNDPTWRNLTALSVHYETQPLPTVLAWYAMRLPLWFQKASTASVFVVELALPFLIFGPARLKRVAALGTIGLQLLIFLTGNYTFFNVLAIALCAFLFDDAWWSRWFRIPEGAQANGNRFVSAALMLFVMTVSCVELGSLFSRVPVELNAIVDRQSPFGLVNGYGLFASMTTTRPEIQLEGSQDGEHWQPYVFRDKPGPLDRAPGWVAPFQPRLDWQMWFAALGSYRENPWFVQFMLQLLQGSKPVLALLDRDPFGGVAPKQVRAVVYEYHFTNFEERAKTGNWWKREYKGLYFPPVSLKSQGEKE